MSQEQFGSWSLASAAVAVLLAEFFEPVLLAAVHAGETAAWLAMLLAGLFAILLFWPAAAFMERLPKGNLVNIARSIAGIPGAVAVGVAVSGLVIFHTGLILRETSEMATSAIFPHTPQTVAMVTLGICAVVGAWGGLPGIIRLARSFMPLLVLAAALLLVGALPWSQFTFLQPFWGPGPLPLLGNSFLLAALFAPMSLFLLMVPDGLRDRGGLVRAGVVPVVAVALILSAGAAIFLAIYPLPAGRSITFPMHLLARLISGGRFFDRLEGIWITFWFWTTACHLAVQLHVAAIAIGDALGLDTKVAIPPLATMAASIALFPRDQGLVLSYHLATIPFALVIGFGLPLALVLGSAIKRRWTAHAS